jgi:tetratricopeptide (TPR) repeat protein
VGWVDVFLNPFLRGRTKVDYAEPWTIAWPALLIVAGAFLYAVGFRLLLSPRSSPLAWFTSFGHGDFPPHDAGKVNLAIAAAAAIAAFYVIACTAVYLGASFAVLVTMLLVGLAPFTFDVHNLPGWSLAWMLCAATLAVFVAREFSRTVLRVFAATVLVIGAMLVVKLGAQEVEGARFTAADKDVATLRLELATIKPMVDDEVAASRAAVEDAMSNLDDAVDVATISKQRNPTIAAVTTLRKRLDAPLDKMWSGAVEDAWDDLQAVTVTADLSTAARDVVDKAKVAKDAALANADIARVHKAHYNAFVVAGRDVDVVQAAAQHRRSCSGSDAVQQPGASVAQSLAVCRASAAAKVAEVGLATGAGGFSQDDLDEKRAAVESAKAAVGDPADATSVSDVVAKGATALIGVVPVLGDANVPIALEVAGWAVLGALLFLGYRWLEIRNGVGAVGPVGEITLDGVADPDKLFEAELRTCVVQNVPEPGAIPGADTTRPVTDLLDAAGPEATRNVLKALVELASSIVPKTGYAVAASVLQPPEHDAAAPTQILVRVLDARTRTTCAAKTLTGDDTNSAVRTAGYWAAGWILHHASTVPKWARWDEASAESLETYLTATARGDANIADLDEAISATPTSGLLLMLAGARHDLAGEYPRALGYYVRAATMYPRYPAARYRVAVSLSAIASNPVLHWNNLEQGERDALTASLDRLKRRVDGHTDPASLTNGSSPTQTKDRLCQLAVEHLDQLSRATSWQWVLHNALRRSERRYWVPIAGATGAPRWSRRLLKWTARSARPLALLRGHQTDAAEDAFGEVEPKINKPDGWWQLLYNAACYKAEWARIDETVGLWARAQEHRDDAVAMLEQAIERPGSHQLNREWCDKDPDLEPLADDDRFETFKRQLHGPGETP